jgi:predicted DCC family thiol-disulfide oxidoreductase YuxK
VQRSRSARNFRPESPVESKVTNDAAVILFDGVCNLCDGTVRFIAANDPARRFRFAVLQSSQAARALAPFARDPATFDSIVLIERGRLFERSDAALRIASELRAPFPVAAALLAIPTNVRDTIYAWIAANRYAVFGKRDVCTRPDPSLEDRFFA